MILQAFVLVIAVCNVSMRAGSQGSDSKRCLTKITVNCSTYIVCTDDVDHHIYPGRITTLVQDVFIPRGPTPNASSYFMTPTDMSVIISDVYLAFQDDSLTMSNPIYEPNVTVRSSGRVRLSTEAAFHFGDINCNGTRKVFNVSKNSTAVLSSDMTRVDTSNTSADSDNGSTPDIGSKDPCVFCLLQLVSEYLMADISDVSENSTRTVSTTFVFDKVTIQDASVIVMRPDHNSSKKSNFTMNIPDVVEWASGNSKVIQLKALFADPSSAYKLIFISPNPYLRIATVRIDVVGQHYESIIPTTKGAVGDDFKYCSGGPDTRIIDFGYLPNKGAYDDNAPTSANLVEFGVILSLTREAIAGSTYPIQIYMEVDSILTMKAVKHFNGTKKHTIQSKVMNITATQKGPLLPKSGAGKIILTWDVPPLSSAFYSIRTSTRRYSGPGGDGVIISGIDVAVLGSNFLCAPQSVNWKMDTNAGIKLTNIPYSIKPSANKFGFEVYVLALPNLVGTYSSHELTLTLFVDGQEFTNYKFYFNITDREIFMTPNTNGQLPINIYFDEECRSITSSTDVSLILHTDFDRQYGRLNVEFPLPSHLSGQTFALCGFRIRNGFNILQLYHTNITRYNDGNIEKVLADFSPLSNIHLLDLDGKTVNYITMKMVVTFIDTSLQIDTLPASFTARMVSNNRTIWTGRLPITKPSIEYHPDFVVVTEVVKIASANPQNLSFHYSLNGTFYNREAVLWEEGRNAFLFDFPKIAAYFYFSTDPCTVICNVTTVWQPLTDYVSIVNDDNNRILRLLPYALDQDSTTCFDLPIPGNSPPMLWLRLTELNLFRVVSKRFVVSITGENIECGIGDQKSLHVGTSGPANHRHCSIESDIVFCKLLSSHVNATKTRCDIECGCATLLQCSNVHIVLRSGNKSTWKLCELTIDDVI